jgi:hypothetical protein
MICSRCGKEFNGKFCEHCGAPAPSTAAPTPGTYPTEPTPTKKKKKPIYKRWWFYVIVVIAAIAVISSISGNKSEKIKWDDIILSEQLPEPPKKNGKINDNTAEALSVEIYKISDKQFNNYVEACKAKGFTVDSESDYSSSYDAYNAAGYKLSLGYYGSRDQMEIELEKPIEMSAITWPTSKAGNQLPAPKSTTGKFSYENDDGFSVYIGNTSKDDYNSYVKACSDKGFTVNYNKDDNFYDADNNAGWHVSIKYEGNNIMSIDIDAPSESSTAPSASEDTTKPAESKPAQSKPAKTANNDSDMVDGMHRDFKEAMDSYEEFFDEYVAFMKKYENSDNPMSMFSDYTKFMSQYSETMQKLDEWKSKDLNTKEAAYLLDVTNRINKKLLEVAE